MNPNNFDANKMLAASLRNKKMIAFKNFVKHQKAKRMFHRSSFNINLEKATSELQLEPDWEAILMLTALIRQGDIGPKMALAAIKKKLNTENVHSVYFALLVLEACMKNCGNQFHAEVATRANMEDLRDLLKNTQNEKIRDKVLELIQAWAHAFQSNPSFCAVNDMYNLLKIENFKFPMLKKSDTLLSSSQAPDWKEGDSCQRCRTLFSLFERQHHCRCCGHPFCHKCSSKTRAIPKYGYEKEVRVCDDCYDQLSRPDTLTANNSTSNASTVTSTRKKVETISSSTTEKTPEQLKEEEDLEIALALSKSEQEFKEQEQQKQYNDYYVSSISSTTSSLLDHKFESRSPPLVDSPSDPNLDRYLDRKFWEQVHLRNSEPSAPYSNSVASSTSSRLTENNLMASPSDYVVNETVPENDEYLDKFRSQLSSVIEIFVTRMNINRQRNRSFANDTGLQQMFEKISSMQNPLHHHIQELNDKRGKFEVLQDKLVKIKEARVALKMLRAEHEEKLRIEAEQAKMNNKLQLESKLVELRKNKEQRNDLHFTNQAYNHHWANANAYMHSNMMYPPNMYSQPNVYTSTAYPEASQAQVHNYAHPLPQQVSYDPQTSQATTSEAQASISQPASVAPVNVPNVSTTGVPVNSNAPLSATQTTSIVAQPIPSPAHIPSQIPTAAAYVSFTPTVQPTIPPVAVTANGSAVVHPLAPALATPFPPQTTYINPLHQPYLSYNPNIPVHLQPSIPHAPFGMQALAAALPQIPANVQIVNPAVPVQVSEPEPPKPEAEENPLISFD